MTELQQTRIIEALEILSKETDVEAEEIVNLLIGFCWDVEDAGRIEELLSMRV